MRCRISSVGGVPRLLVLLSYFYFAACAPSQESADQDHGWAGLVDPICVGQQGGWSFAGISLPFGAVHVGLVDQDGQLAVGVTYKDQGAEVDKWHLLLKPQLPSSVGARDAWELHRSSAGYLDYRSGDHRLEMTVDMTACLIRYTPVGDTRHSWQYGVRRGRIDTVSQMGLVSGTLPGGVPFALIPGVDSKALILPPPGGSEAIGWGQIETDEGEESITLQVQFAAQKREDQAITVPAFDEAKSHAIRAWNEVLGKIQVTSADVGGLTRFYTSLYSVMLSPIRQGDGEWTWDGITPWLERPGPYASMLSLTQPDLFVDVVRSVLAGAYADQTAVESTSIGLVAEAYLKGHRPYAIDSVVALLRSPPSTDGDLAVENLTVEAIRGRDQKAASQPYSDWCKAQLAIIAGDVSLYELHQRRSLLPTGTTGNEISWGSTHDVRALIRQAGGPEAFAARLDEKFGRRADVDRWEVEPQELAQMGHIPYLYNYAGAPWLTQSLVKGLVTRQGGDGSCVNQPVPYLFDCLGFYPVNAAEGTYVFGTPQFSKVEIDVGEGRSFVMRVRFLTEENKYIQAATLNEAPLTRSFIRHYDIMEGGELIIEMGPQPNYLHWTDEDARPLSASDPDVE